MKILGIKNQAMKLKVVKIHAGKLSIYTCHLFLLVFIPRTINIQLLLALFYSILSFKNNNIAQKKYLRGTTMTWNFQTSIQNFFNTVMWELLCKVIWTSFSWNQNTMLLLPYFKFILGHLSIESNTYSVSKRQIQLILTYFWAFTSWNKLEMHFLNFLMSLGISRQ